MSITEKKYFSIKWIICGTLELVFTVSEIVVFSKYDLEFLTGSIIILNIICSIVKSLASLLFVATFHKVVSAYSIPIITAIITHGVIIPIMVYYTIYAIIQEALNSQQLIIISAKFIWFVFEILFIYFLLKRWAKIQKSKIQKRGLNWRKKESSKQSDINKMRKMNDYEPSKLRIFDELSPEEGQKRRYIQNQSYIHKCLQQNAKTPKQRLSLKASPLRGFNDEPEVLHVRSKSIQSRNESSTNQFEQLNISVTGEEKLWKKPKLFKIVEPVKTSVNSSDVSDDAGGKPDGSASFRSLDKGSIFF